MEIQDFQNDFEAQRAAMLRKLEETHAEKVAEQKKKRSAELQRQMLRSKKFEVKKKPKKEKEKESPAAVSSVSTTFRASGQMLIKKQLDILCTFKLPTTKRTFYSMLKNYTMYKKVESDNLNSTIQRVANHNFDLIVLEETNDPYIETNEIIDSIRNVEIEKEVNNVPILVLKKDVDGIYDNFIAREKSVVSLNLMGADFDKEFKNKIAPIFNNNRTYFSVSRAIQVEWEEEISTIYFTNDINMDDAVNLKKFLN